MDSSYFLVLILYGEGKAHLGFPVTTIEMVEFDDDF